MSPTTYNVRTPVNTSYNLLRIGGAYLINRLGEYILTRAGEKIIIRVPGGNIPLTNYTIRDTVNTTYNVRPII